MAEQQANNSAKQPAGGDGDSTPRPPATGPAQPRILDYGHHPMRRSFGWLGRDEIRNFLKAMAWVVPLTILIWVYAEREQTTQTAPWPIPVAVKTTDPKKQVTIVSPDRNIMARLSGPRRLVEEVANTLTAGTPQRVEIFVPAGMLGVKPGTRISVPTVWVGNNPLFVSRGVTVSECLPVSLLVEVDDIVDSQPLTVTAEPGTANLDGLPTFTPATVMFHGPTKVLDAFPRGPDGKALIYASFKDTAAFKTDGLITSAVLPLATPPNSAGEQYSLSAASVEAKFTLKALDQKGTILSMPVFIQGPRSILDEYHIEVQQTLANVEVSGPPSVINKLNTSDLVPIPKAILEILPEDKDKAGTPLMRAPRFELPPDLKTTPDSAKIKIQFTLQPR